MDPTLVTAWRRLARPEVVAGVAVGLLLVLVFLAAGLPPNPLGDQVQDWFLGNPDGGPGSFDSRAILGAVLLVALVAGVPTLIALLLLLERPGRRAPAGDAPAPGLPAEVARAARHPGRWRWLAALALAGGSTLAAGVLSWLDAAEASVPPTPVALEAGGSSLQDAPAHVEVHATARRDLGSAIWERTTVVVGQ